MQRGAIFTVGEHNWSFLIERDLCECRKVSVKFPSAVFLFVSFIGKSFPFLFQFFCEAISYLESTFSLWIQSLVYLKCCFAQWVRLFQRYGVPLLLWNRKSNLVCSISPRRPLELEGNSCSRNDPLEQIPRCIVWATHLVPPEKYRFLCLAACVIGHRSVACEHGRNLISGHDVDIKVK